MWRDDAYLLDMLLAARQAREFAAGQTLESFRDNNMLQYAVVYLVQVIGEAARLVSDDCRQSHPEIPWSAIVGMRHHLVHEYFRVAPEEVWSVVANDLPPLIAQLEPLVPPEEPTAPA